MYVFYKMAIKKYSRTLAREFIFKNDFFELYCAIRQLLHVSIREITRHSSMKQRFKEIVHVFIQLRGTRSVFGHAYSVMATILPTLLNLDRI